MSQASWLSQSPLGGSEGKTSAPISQRTLTSPSVAATATAAITASAASTSTTITPSKSSTSLQMRLTLFLFSTSRALALRPLLLGCWLMHPCCDLEVIIVNQTTTALAKIYIPTDFSRYL